MRENAGLAFVLALEALALVSMAVWYVTQGSW